MMRSLKKPSLMDRLSFYGKIAGLFDKMSNHSCRYNAGRNILKTSRKELLVIDDITTFSHRR